jgi:putative ABC transport system permease protein
VIRSGIRRWFHLALRRRDHWEREVEDEIKLHLALRVEQLIANGATPDDAYREAIRRFGPLTESRARMIDAARKREEHMRRTEYFADFKQDLSFALRTLRRQKAWTTVTVLTLALGLGATTAVFSVVSSLLIHAVPYPNGDRVMLVYQELTKGASGAEVLRTQPRVLRLWQEGSHSFEALEGFVTQAMTMRAAGTSVEVHTASVEPTFPEFAGVRPIVGRMFDQSDIASGDRVTLLSEGFWRTRLGGRTDVIGRRITLDSSLYTIIGVLPGRLRRPQPQTDRLDVWLPLDLSEGGGLPQMAKVEVVGRLRPGVSAQAASRELDSLFARVAGFKLDALPLRSIVMPPAKHLSFYESLLLLAFAVGLVLLIACANIAHLLVARASGRQRELAIRTALGAGRGRVLRQLLTESLLLAVGGTAIGVFVGWVGLRLLITLRPPALAELASARLDSTTLVLAALVAATTAIVFGLLGSAQAGRVATPDALKNTSTSPARGHRARTRTLLVVSEMALSATLVVGATMLVRSVIKMQNADLGFEPKGLYTLSIGGLDSRPGPERTALTRSVMQRLSAMPGIRSVAVTSNPTGGRTFAISTLEVEGEDPPPLTATMRIDVNRIGSAYFQTMNMRLVEGTPFTDTTAAGHQVIVNAGFARKHWPVGSAVGRRIRRMKTEPWMTIAGVANDALTSGARSDASAPRLYSPTDEAGEYLMIILRTDGTADPVTPVRALIRSIDPGFTATVQSVEAQMAETIAAPRFIMLVLTLFTVIALVLASIGLYGVMSYRVAERTREIGIRVALGATRGRVTQMVIASGVAVALIGSGVGVILATWGTKLIERQLYDVGRLDIPSFSAAIVVLFLATVVASIAPTYRALAVDPMTAIRAD